MKVSGKILLCILIWSGFSASCCEAAVYHSDGSPANVQFIHNTQAVDGDTITLPAGTFSWTTYVTITKAVTIQGQTTTDSSSGTFDDNTIILDNVNRASGEGGTIIKIESVNGKSYRVSGITFSPGAVSDDSGSGAIKLMGDSHAVRFDHCHFGGMVHQAIYIAVWGAIQGVIDHNVMAFEHGQSQSFYIGMGNWGGRTNGHGSWADPPYYGSEKFIFIEDNYLINTSGHEFAGNTDGSRGGRSVFRHNRCYNIEMQGHGTEAEYYRGERCKEIYNNEFHFTQQSSAGGVRSGGLITHDNTWYGAPLYGGMVLQTYRSFFRGPSSPWGGASGDNPWDYNVTEPDGTHIDGHSPFLYEGGTVSSATQTTLTDTTKNWITNGWAGYTLKRLSDNGISLILSNTNNTLTVLQYTDPGGIIWAPGDQYQIHRVLISMDQPCRGKGDLVTGDDLNPVNSTTGTRSWTHDALEPCYSWNDRYTPTNAHINIRPGWGPPVLVEGRDFFNNTPMPGYTPYTYPHPLAMGAGTGAGRAVIADFNSDGHPDYVLSNPNTRQTAIWYLNNNNYQGGALGPSIRAGWSLDGVADFNRDAHPDYALFNSTTDGTAIWHMSGPTRIASAYGPTLPGGWDLVTTADFNGNNYPDYVLYNASTRRTAIWYLNNNVYGGGGFGPTLPVNWSLVGVADFNRDGHRDYLLFNSITHQTAIWYLSGRTFVGGAYGPSIPSGWALVATADFNGDGRPDYVLYNGGTRQTAIWYLNNNVYVSAAYGPTLPAGWSLVSP